MSCNCFIKSRRAFLLLFAGTSGCLCRSTPTLSELEKRRSRSWSRTAASPQLKYNRPRSHQHQAWVLDFQAEPVSHVWIELTNTYNPTYFMLRCILAQCGQMQNVPFFCQPPTCSGTTHPCITQNVVNLTWIVRVKKKEKKGKCILQNMFIQQRTKKKKGQRKGLVPKWEREKSCRHSKQRKSPVSQIFPHWNL